MNYVTQRELEQVADRLIDLEIRIKRIEEFFRFFPNPHEYIHYPQTDELYAQALKTVSRQDTVTIALLQRKLAIGYSRAARILDELEENGIIGPAIGSNPRQVLRKA